MYVGYSNIQAVSIQVLNAVDAIVTWPDEKKIFSIIQILAPV